MGGPDTDTRKRCRGRGPAEGAGFEPAVRVNGLRFSRPVHSTALPPLRGRPSLYGRGAARRPGARAARTGPNGWLRTRRSILRGSPLRGSRRCNRAIHPSHRPSSPALAAAAAGSAGPARPARAGRTSRSGSVVFVPLFVLAPLVVVASGAASAETAIAAARRSPGDRQRHVERALGTGRWWVGAPGRRPPAASPRSLAAATRLRLQRDAERLELLVELGERPGARPSTRPPAGSARCSSRAVADACVIELSADHGRRRDAATRVAEPLAAGRRAGRGDDAADAASDEATLVDPVRTTGSGCGRASASRSTRAAARSARCGSASARPGAGSASATCASPRCSPTGSRSRSRTPA